MGYGSRRFEALLDRSSEARRAKDRLGLLREAMGVAVEDLPLVPLWSGEVPNGMGADVDWQPRLDLRVRAASMRRR